MNEAADRIAKEAYAVDEQPEASLIPRTALLPIAKSLESRDFNQYLENEVKLSADELTPPRDLFRRPTPIYSLGARRKVDVVEFRLQSGHNRLRRHLKRLMIESSDKCRFCGSESEDAFHVILNCPETTKKPEIEAVRSEIGFLSRTDWNKWLTSKDCEACVS